MGFTRREMMIIAAAREIKDGETLLTGAYWPILPSVLAKKTHAPNAIFVFEGGDNLQLGSGSDTANCP